jgi:hypothetical protein
MTPSMRVALETAACRERGNLCPVIGSKGRMHAAAEQMLLDALEKRGFIEYLGNRAVPVINDAGRSAIS